MLRRRRYLRWAMMFVAAIPLSCADAASPVIGPAQVDPAFNEGGGVARITFTGAPTVVESDLAVLGVIPTPPPLVRGDELASNSAEDTEKRVFFIPGGGVAEVVAERPYVRAINPLHPAPYQPLPGPDPVAEDYTEIGPFRVSVQLDSVRYPVGSAYWLLPRYSVTNTADTSAVLRGFSHIPPDLRDHDVCNQNFAVGTSVERFLTTESGQTLQGDPGSSINQAWYPVTLNLMASETYACTSQEMLAVGDLGYPAPVASYRVGIRIALDPAPGELELWVRIED